MQHHSRPAPHMQRSHHMAANPNHVPIINMVGTLPQQQTNQQQAAQTPHPKQQQQHHLSNGPPPPNAVAGATLQPQHMRNNRLNHQQQQHHQQSQMQKIRQQHQHLNNNTHKNNQQQHNTQQQQPQYSNNSNVPQHKHHMAGLQQQQRNMSHHQQQQQQQQHHHMKNHSQHSAGNNNILSKQQILTSALTSPQQSQHHYYAANKTKYNNNSTTTTTTTTATTNTNYTAPKSILQNPNRSIKSKVQIAPTINEDVATVAVTVADTKSTPTNADIPLPVSSSNNITIIPETSTTTPVVSAAATNVDVVAAENMAGTIALAETLKISNMIEAISLDSKKENKPIEEATSESDELPGSNSLNGGSNNILPNEDTSASKNSNEKTPMCLVNELARFNKITHQYRLTSEEGPPHCKCFTVTLKLGDEEYAAEGFKIKKAQHMAATMAIEKTKYKHPLRKTNRRSEDSSYRTNITPTVELNALAMKLGQQTYYLFDPGQMPPADGQPGDVMMPPFGVPPGPLGGHLMSHSRMMDPSFMRRGAGGFGPPPNMPHLQHQHPRFGAQQRGGYPSKFMQRFPPMMVPPPPGQAHNGIIAARFGLAPRTTCKITLIVGKQKFVGIGRTLQQAKHDAASRALQVLKTQATNQLNEMLNQSLDESINKSPVSLVHEIGIKRSLTVHFKVVREDGPAHMKNFVTHCIVGDIVTEGEGNGKKISKKRAAQRMLKELKNLPPLTPTRSPVKRVKTKTASNSRSGGAGGNSNATPDGKPVERRKRTSGSSIKEKTADDDADSENPITKLIQLQQNLKEKEPVFELIAKNGNELSYRREFIIEVSAQGKVARGIGSTKKFAKRNAALNLLTALGYGEPEAAPTATKEVSQLAISSKEVAASAPAVVDKNVAGILPDSNNTAPTTTAIKIDDVLDVPLISTSAGQVPGILILRQNKKHATKKKEISANVAPLEKRNKELKKKEEPTKGKIPTPTTTENNIVTPSVTTTVATIIESSEETATNITNSNATPSVSNSISTTRNTVQTVDTVVSTAPATTVSNTSSSVATVASSSSSGTSSVSLHMKDQLLYLAKLLGFDVDFSDYPKGNHNDFLTIVTLTTNPSQICHGVGTSSEESQNDAARNALKILSELGLNNAKK